MKPALYNEKFVRNCSATVHSKRRSILMNEIADRLIRQSNILAWPVIDASSGV